MKALDLANYFVERASEIDENDLTNLKLQKLLYFAQGEYVAANDKPLFDDEIEAWNLGPVVREVYNQFKSCGSFPITAFDMKTEKPKIDPKIKEFLDNVWEKYGMFSAVYLVSKTHEPNSPWTKHYQKDTNKVIPLEDLTEYFEDNSIL